MTGLMIEAALRGLVFAAAVGTGLAALRVSNVPVRKAAWTLVLIASMAMPFLMRVPLLSKIPRGWSWVVPIRMQATPVVKAAAPAPVVSPTEEVVPPVANMAVADAPKHARQAIAIEPLDVAPAPVATASPALGGETPTPISAVTPKKFAWPSWERMAIWAYWLVGGALLLRLLIGFAAAVRLWMTAKEVSPLIAPEPGVRTSPRIASPVTIGSGIVLPADYEQWERRRLRMVLAHERSHVRQLDFYVQLAAGIYTAVFWFSPLGWCLRRHLAALGETISDRAGVEAANSSSDYAQVVLEFAALPHRGLPGVAMARSCNLSRRIESLLNERLFHSAFAEGRRRAVASLLLIPVALFAATALVRVPSAMAQSNPPQSNPPNPANAPNPQAAPANPGPSQSGPAQAPPAAAAPTTGQAFPDQGPNASKVLGPAPADQPAPQAPPMPPPPQGQGVTQVPPGAAQTPPLPPLPPAPDVDVDSGGGMGIGEGQSGSTTTITNGSATHYHYHIASNGDSYAVVSGSGANVDFSGDWSPAQKAQIDAARRMAHGPFLWFTHDGKSYVVTDPAIVARLDAMYEPMKELGVQQRLLGRTQRNLGEQQRELSKEETDALNLSVQTQVNAEMQKALADLEKEQSQWNAQTMAAMQAELKAAQAELSPEKMAEIQKEVQAAGAELTPEKMAAVQAEMKAVQARLSPEEVAEMQKQIKAAAEKWSAQNLAQMQARLAEIQARLGEMQARLSQKQADFGSRMGALGAEQGRLGEEEGRLGAAQARMAARIQAEVQRIIQESIRNGKAQPVQ